jgi:dihydroorotate dehydrogenase
LVFPNRVGLAAGLDKNGQAIDTWLTWGFGFIEVGTITPQPQPGNPKPRVFRLPESEALINRLGFNNQGMDQAILNIKKNRHRSGAILGINIGKNATTPLDQAIEDYVYGLKKAYPYADYVTINISSPNTQNLRRLQDDTTLPALLIRLHQERLLLVDQYGKKLPLFVKVAPDINDNQIACIADHLQGCCMDGVIATNTTVSREGVQHHPQAHQTGGLSGKPLTEKSTMVIHLLRKNLDKHFPIIGVGGIMSGEEAVTKIQAGADLVQLYTGLIYHGPALVHEVAQAVALTMALSK